MNGKKRYLILALLLFLGIGAMTFAGGNDELEPADGNGGSGQVEDADRTPERVDDVFNDSTVDSEVINDEDINDTVTANPNPGNQNGNQGGGNNNPTTPVDPSTLIAEVEKMLGDASSKEDVDSAEDYFDENQIKNLTDAFDGEGKENLIERVEKLEQIFGDNNAPKISGISDNEVTKNDVTITIEDDLEVTTTITLNGEEIPFENPFTENGVYTLTVTDAAKNSVNITFTIDKNAPKTNLVNGKHYENFTLDIEDESNFKIEVTKNHTEKYEVENGTEFTEEATYKFVITDEAGNSITIWTAIDKTKPGIVVTDTEVDGTACKKITVSDRYLMNVLVNDTKYTRNDFSVGANGEYFMYTNTICEEGEYVVLGEDKIGNAYSETFTIDRSAPVVSYSTVRFNNKTGEVVGTYNKYTTNYYVTNGDVFTYAIAFEEKLAYAPKLTIGGKEVTLALVDKETYRDDKRIYLYEGNMTISENDNFAQGELKVELSDIVDEFGNELTDVNYLKPNQTTNNRVIVYDSVAPKLTYVAILSKKENYDKAIKGDTIRFLVRFNEEIDLNSKTFKVKFDGKDIKFIKSQDVGYEYIVDYTIPSTSTMETGNLKFEVYGYTDKAGNGGEAITKANHSKYNNVYYDGIAPTITLKGEIGLNKNEWRIAVGSMVYMNPLYIGAEVTDNSLEEPLTILPTAITRCYPTSANKACHSFEIGAEELFDTDTAGERYHLTYSYTDDSGYTTTKTMLMVIDAYKNKTAVDMGDYREINITSHVNNGYLPFYNEVNNDKDLVINGNGYTATQNVTHDAFLFDSIYNDGVTNRAALGNVFSSVTYNKITLNDLTFKGTTQTIALGHWDQFNQANTKKHNTEFNNVNIIDLRVVSYSANVAPAVNAYGTYTFNNVKLYGTKLSETFDPNGWTPWDLVGAYYSTGVANDSKLGNVRIWDHANFTANNTEIEYLYAGNNNKTETVITIGAGSVVDKIIIWGKNVKLTIEEGAVVKELDYNNRKLSTDSVIVEGTVLLETRKK